VVAKLGLAEQDLYIPTTGAATGKFTLVLGDAFPVAHDGPNNNLVYAPEESYPLSQVAELTRLFAKPKQMADFEALKKRAAEAEKSVTDG
jgi:hypothetical protein